MKKIIADKLFDGNKILEGAVVLFDEKGIQYVGKDQKVKADETYRAEFATPAFIDISSGIGLKEESLGNIEGNDFNEETNPATPELLALDGINPFDEAFPKALRGGVLETLVLPGLSNPIGGRGALIKTFGKTVQEMLIKSPCGVRFSLNSEPKSTYGKQKKMPMTRMGSAYIIRNALYKAKEYKEKKEKNFSLFEESLIPLLSGKEKAFFGAFRSDDIATSIRISKEFNLNSVITFATEADIVLDLIKQNKVPVAFGPIILSRFSRELRHLSPKVAATLIEKGIETAVISGHPLYPAEFLRIQLGLIIAEGISEEKALKTITSTPAHMLNLKDRGEIKKGKKANILLFNGEPWETKSRIKNIFYGGVNYE